MSGADGDLRSLAEVMRSRHPYPLLARMRERSPYLASDGLVVVGRHAHCAGVLRHPLASSARDRARTNRRPGPRSRNFINLDPPDHTRLRRLVARAFTPRVVDRLEPLIRAASEDLLDAVGDRTTLDIVAEIASPLPMSVICGLLGVPPGDREQLRGWSAMLSPALDLPELRPADAPAAAAAARARADYISYFKELIAFRRSTPADDLISHLIQMEAGGDRLTASELIATCVLLVNAGHETSVNLISNGMLTLLDHPEQRRLLGTDPSRAPAVVEEVLRHDAPIQLTTRVAAGDLDLDGFPVAAGDMLLLLLGAANRDPRTFPRPEEFAPCRHRPAPHLTFAAGPHFCLGASLARLEGAIVLQALAARLVDPELEPAGLTYKPNLSLRGPERLPVTVRGVRGRRSG